MSQGERLPIPQVLKPGQTSVARQRQAVASPESVTNHCPPPPQVSMQHRVGRNLEVPPVTTPAALEVLGHYYDGVLETSAALALLDVQGVACADAWLALGRAHNITSDLHAEGIVGTQLDEDVRLSTTLLDWWLVQIRDTELETHIARGLWLINQLKPWLAASDVRELKARYVVHDIGKLGPPGLRPTHAGLILQSFELRRLTLQQPVASVFAKHFGSYSQRLLAEINHCDPLTKLPPQATMRVYFNCHEAWGGQHLARLFTTGHISASVASHAHKHHHLDRRHAPWGLLTYLDIYEASTGRMSYDAGTGQETRCQHADAMAALWHRFRHIDRPSMSPEQVAAYTHMLTLMERLAPHLPGYHDNVAPQHPHDDRGAEAGEKVSC